MNTTEMDRYFILAWGIGLLAILFALMLHVARASDDPAPAPAAQREVAPGIDYDPKAQTLSVTDRARIGLLLCIQYGQGSEPVCKLPAEWLGR